MKAIILARVSTEEQMSDGQSIPAQLAKAREYAKRKTLLIQSEYQFDESSLKDRRTKFEQVIDEIKKSKEKVALIVETVDRLQRSFKESVMLDELRKQGKLEIHFIRENLIIHKDSNSSEIQRWDLAVFLAKSFVLQISDNVKRTNEFKIRNGEWIGKAPLGYINITKEDGSKNIEPDPIRSHFIVEMFELYSTGNYSLQTLAKGLKDRGLTSNMKTPKPVGTALVYHSLKNPFYYGMMSYKGNLFHHKYAPLVSKDLFDMCQRILAGYHKKPFAYASKPYAFRGLIKCADSACGCTITPETHKGHNYYSCTNGKKIHTERVYVKDEDLFDSVKETIAGLEMPEAKIKETVDKLKKINKAKNEFYFDSLAGLRKEHDQIEKRISNSYDLMADGSITKDMFNSKLKEYKEKQSGLEAQMALYTDADESFYMNANILLHAIKKASQVFEGSEPATQRQILNFLLQNLKLSGKKLSFTLKTPFDRVLEANRFVTGLRR
ncbi:MAG: recombinase family protein [Candidatus Staskawiczbacteria bacterium]|nr:recombinase family protein [Candidatus Staskawiczbacteria bacterium]